MLSRTLMRMLSQAVLRVYARARTTGGTLPNSLKRRAGDLALSPPMPGVALKASVLTKRGPVNFF